MSTLEQEDSPVAGQVNIDSRNRSKPMPDFAHSEARELVVSDQHVQEAWAACEGLGVREWRGGGEVQMVCAKSPTEVTIIALASGACQLVNHQARVVIRAGEFWIQLPNLPLSLISKGASRVLQVTLSEQRLAEIAPKWRDWSMRPLKNTGAVGAVCINFIESLILHADTLSEFDVVGLREVHASLLGVVLNGLDVSADDSSSAQVVTRVERFHIERIKSYARQHLSDPHLNLSLISAGVGLSVSYIHKLFAREPVRLMQWVLAQRLDACMRDLQCCAGVKAPIAQIASRWGFEDPAHFSRTFRARFGLTPSQMRDKALRSCEGVQKSDKKCSS